MAAEALSVALGSVEMTSIEPIGTISVRLSLKFEQRREYPYYCRREESIISSSQGKAIRSGGMFELRGKTKVETIDYWLCGYRIQRMYRVSV